MTLIHIFALFTILVCLAAYLLIKQQSFFCSHKFIAAVFGAALLLRLLLAYCNMGYDSDTACFAYWADRMFAVGPGAFYSPDVFTDYPPGYMYISYLIGCVRSLLEIESYSGLHLLLLKLPSIICDMACAYLLYREGSKHIKRVSRHSENAKDTNSVALILSAAYLFNPAIILNSSVWGQVDSVYTLTVVLMCLYLTHGRMLPAYISFGIGVLIKPQMLVFTPVLLAAVLDRIFLRDFSVRKLHRNVLEASCAALGTILLALPFGFGNVISQYTSTLASYPYASVNAYNFWGLLGQSWASQDNTFLFLSFKSWGTIVILLIVLFSFIISLRMGKSAAKYPLLGAFIILSMFVFSVRMHERYMYTGLILLLFTFLYKPVKSLYFCYLGFSLLHFYNTAHVLYFYDPYNYNRTAPIILGVSAGMVACTIYMYYVIYHYYGKRAIPLSDVLPLSGGTSAKARNTMPTSASCTPESASSLLHSGSPLAPVKPRPSGKPLMLTKIDLLLLVGITVLYSFFALYDLGDTKAPQSTYEMAQGDSITLDFGEGNSPSTLSYYIAPWHNRNLTLEGRNHPDHEWQYLGDLELSTVFTWKELDLGYTNIRFIRLTLSDTQASILELAFHTADGQMLLPVNRDEYATLFDENQLYPENSSFRDSMYFDEIYHGRTAYEFVNGLTAYENTHPPLGKIFIALGVAICGMTPFGWRIIGTLFGIAMLPFLYLFGKKLTHSTFAAALSCFLFAFDFMHFVQTRIATIDVYITFFVILMYFFMYLYCNMSFYDTSLKKTLLPLGACGVSMGLGIACKWTGAYASVGLAILFFATLFRRYREYQYARCHPTESSNGISHRAILNNFVPYTWKTIGFCMIFFVAIPCMIYLLSYLPFVDYSNSGLLDRMLTNQTTMFNYHSDLEATHSFSSSWQEWPIMIRPIWYYSNVVAETAEIHLREGISAFGNPLVWWIGIPAFCYMIYLALKKKDRTAVFLIIGYLAQYLPWFFVTRITFIYHYFPSVAFVVLMIIHSIMQLRKHHSKRLFLLCILLYAAAAFGLFLLFYPVLAGQPVEVVFVDKYLRWFDTWVLIAN